MDAAAKAIARFESETRHRDFHNFHVDQVVAFKRALRATRAVRTGDQLSAATMGTTLAHLKRFFVWLASQPGYRSRLKFSDAEYFNLSEKDSRVAAARRDRPGPTLEQVRHVLSQMPESNVLEMRDKAIIAFVLLTGARDGAVISFRFNHLDLARKCVEQDARVVKTKYSKTFTTYFFPVGDEVCAVVANWARTLREDYLWGNDDPLFPATKIEVGTGGKFEVAGLARTAWSSASPVREIFRRAFTAAGLPYFNPHSIRKTLVQLGQTKCRTPEEFKAWSQNLGHEAVLTTFSSYGSVGQGRQAEIIQALAGDRKEREFSADVAEAVFQKIVERNLFPQTRRS